MKKILFMITALIILTAANVLAANFVGNSNSKIFHYNDCTFVNRMKPANKVIFNSREEAVQTGYRPCKKCIGN